MNAEQCDRMIGLYQDEVRRLLAGLGLIAAASHGGAPRPRRQIAQSVLDGADVRKKAEEIAVCYGTWKSTEEHDEPPQGIARTHPTPD